MGGRYLLDTNVISALFAREQTVKLLALAEVLVQPLGVRVQVKHRGAQLSQE
jgi:predicted nucleic acid-binding protein